MTNKSLFQKEIMLPENGNKIILKQYARAGLNCSEQEIILKH